MIADGAISTCVIEPQDQAPEALAGSALTNQLDGEIVKPDYFCVEDGVRFAGRHFLVDLKGGQGYDDIDFVEQTLRACIAASGATLLHIHLHHFTPYGGVSGVAVLAESHISIHTWPEEKFAALDVFMCGGTEPEKAIDVLRNAFKPDVIDVQMIKRGRVDGA